MFGKNCKRETPSAIYATCIYVNFGFADTNVLGILPGTTLSTNHKARKTSDTISVPFSCAHLKCLYEKCRVITIPYYYVAK